MRLPASHDLIKHGQCQTFASATTGTGTIVDTRGYTYLTVFMAFGTTTGSSATVAAKIQRDSDVALGSPTDMAGWTFGTIASVESADNTMYLLHGPINDTNMERYIRSTITTGGTVTSVPVQITYLLSNGPVVPTSADYTAVVVATGT